MREPVSCLDHADHSTPEWKLGKRQVEEWRWLKFCERMAARGNTVAINYLLNRKRKAMVADATKEVRALRIKVGGAR